MKLFGVRGHTLAGGQRPGTDAASLAHVCMVSYPSGHLGRFFLDVSRPWEIGAKIGGGTAFYIPLFFCCSDSNYSANTTSSLGRHLSRIAMSILLCWVARSAFFSLWDHGRYEHWVTGVFPIVLTPCNCKIDVEAFTTEPGRETYVLNLSLVCLGLATYWGTSSHHDPSPDTGLYSLDEQGVCLDEFMSRVTVGSPVFLLSLDLLGKDSAQVPRPPSMIVRSSSCVPFPYV